MFRWLTVVVIATGCSVGCKTPKPVNLRSPSSPACRHPERHLRGVWESSTREVLVRARDQLPQSLKPTGQHVVAGLDETATAWIAARERICQAARRGEHSRASWQATGACHTRVLARFSRLTQTLTDHPGPTWEHAPHALAALRDQLISCRDSPSASVPDSAQLAAAAQAEVRAWLKQESGPVKIAYTLDSPEGLTLRSVERLSLGERNREHPDTLALFARLASLPQSRQAHAWRGIAQLWQVQSPPLAPPKRDFLRRSLQQQLGNLEPEKLPAPLSLAHTATALALAYPRRSQVATELHAQAQKMMDRLRAHCHCQAFDLDRANTLRARGDNLLRRGDIHRSEDVLHQALAIHRQVRGPNHLDTADTLGVLARLELRAGRYSQAISRLREVLRVRLQHLGMGLQTAHTMNDLARALYYTRALEESLSLHRAALEIRTQTLGPEHPETATSLNNLGAVHRAMGANEDAQARFEQAFKVRQAALGPDHPYTAASLHNLAAMALVFGDPQRARTLHQQALTIREQALGPAHPETARSQQGLAQTWIALDQPARAQPLLESALDTFLAKLGERHPETLRVRELLRDLKNRSHVRPR